MGPTMLFLLLFEILLNIQTIFPNASLYFECCYLKCEMKKMVMFLKCYHLVSNDVLLVMFSTIFLLSLKMSSRRATSNSVLIARWTMSLPVCSVLFSITPKYSCMNKRILSSVTRGKSSSWYIEKWNNTVHPIGKHYENLGDTCMKQKVLNSGKILK